MFVWLFLYDGVNLKIVRCSSYWQVAKNLENKHICLNVGRCALNSEPNIGWGWWLPDLPSTFVYFLCLTFQLYFPNLIAFANGMDNNMYAIP